jgi:predicted esterase
VEDDGEAASTCTGDLAVRGVASKRGRPQRFRADAVGVNRLALLGQSHGCAMSIAYAVRHPECVTKLVLIRRRCVVRESKDPRTNRLDGGAGRGGQPLSRKRHCELDLLG